MSSLFKHDDFSLLGQEVGFRQQKRPAIKNLMKNFPLFHEGGDLEEKILGASGEGVDLPRKSDYK